MDALDWLFAEHPCLRPTRGLWIRPGWRPIVASAFRDILSIASRLDLMVQVVEVKEKFGRLRVQISSPANVHPLFKDVLLRSQQEADSTCDLCGAYGRLRGPGWMRTRCDPHADTMPEPGIDRGS